MAIISFPLSAIPISLSAHSFNHTQIHTNISKKGGPHSILALNFHKKNRLSNLAAMPKPAKIPIDSHRPVSKFRSAILLFLFRTSFQVKAVKPYLKGERYCIQPTHPGRFLRFLKKPEKTKKGIMIKRAAPVAPRGVSAMVPASIPMDIPQRLLRKTMR